MGLDPRKLTSAFCFLLIGKYNIKTCDKRNFDFLLETGLTYPLSETSKIGFVRVCFYVPCGHERAGLLALVCGVLTVSLPFSHRYPGSGVVLDCLIPDLCTLTYFVKSRPISKAQFKLLCTGHRECLQKHFWTINRFQNSPNLSELMAWSGTV